MPQPPHRLHCAFQVSRYDPGETPVQEQRRLDALVQSWRRPNPIAVRRFTKAARPELLPRSTRGVCPNEVRGFFVLLRRGGVRSYHPIRTVMN